jgi:DNA-binding MarR family transcriptional regulator
MSKTPESRVEQIQRVTGAFMVLIWIGRRRFVQLLQPFGLTAPQFMALAALSTCEAPLTMSDLTGVTLHDAPTMTGIVDRLAKMGLVRRSRSQADRRVVLVEATPGGNDLVRQARHILLAEGIRVYDIISDDELDEVERVFTHALERVRTYVSIQGMDMDAELRRLELFMCDPTAAQSKPTWNDDK